MINLLGLVMEFYNRIKMRGHLHIKVFLFIKYSEFLFELKSDVVRKFENIYSRLAEYSIWSNY